jgi:hypothetical protein
MVKAQVAAREHRAFFRLGGGSLWDPHATSHVEKER